MEKIMKYEYLDNAFWEAEDRSILKCIRITEEANGKKRKDVMQFHRTRNDGSECPNWKEVVAKVGLEKIDANTDERRNRKDREEKEKRALHEQQKKSHELEQLFNHKLQAFEIDEIKNSGDRALRGKLRRAKNVVEMNAIAALIVAKEMGYMIKNEESE